MQLALALRRRRLPPERLLVLAWSPLALVEIAGSGHNEAFGLLFVTLALLALETPRRLCAAAQVVFEGLRREIGAGARNFVLTCLRRLGPSGPAFEGAAPDKTGAFDREALARRLVELSAGDPYPALEPLIGVELNLVRDLIEPARLAGIERALSEIQ